MKLSRISISNINAKRLEKISMANNEDKCVCQFRNATALHFHGCSLHRICIRDTEYVPQPVARRLYTITGWRRRAKREVAKSFCDLEARPERIVCQAVVDEMCQGFFPFDECYAAIARVLKKQALVIRCPIWPLSPSKKSRKVRPWSGCRWLHGANGLWACLKLLINCTKNPYSRATSVYTRYTRRD